MNLNFQGYFCYWLTVFYFFLITFLLFAPFFMSENIVFFALVLSIAFSLFSRIVNIQVESTKDSILIPFFRFISMGAYTTIYPLLVFCYWRTSFIIKILAFSTIVLSMFSISKIERFYKK